MKRNPQEKLLTIRCYCEKCHTLLEESIPLTKRELLSSWDETVLLATRHKCEKCGFTGLINPHIYLRIYHKALNKELRPEAVLPKPKAKPLF